MIDAEIQQEYESFLQEVLRDEKVWVLQNQDGMACQSSMEYEDAMCVLFWSNCVRADEEREEDFQDLEAESISLFDFIFQWLPNMAEEGVICGLNWYSGEGGLEVEPMDIKGHLEMILPDDMAARFAKDVDSLN